MNIAGGVLRPDVDLNSDVYGKGTSLRTIFATRDVSAPTEAQGFIVALSSQPTAPAALANQKTSASVSAPVRLPAAAPRMTWDDDLRARIVEMQQMLDGVLADRTPAPVGTSGTAAPEPVTVDRARLVQMRQQLDSMLAVLDRR